MKKLLTVSLGVALLAVASLAAQAPAGTQASKAAKWTPPRAADGHADLSGVWVYDDGGDAIFQNVVEAALAKRKLISYDPTTGNYKQFWMVEREIDHRTSLITVPADGRLPSLTPEAQARRGPSAGAQGQVQEGGPAGRADGPEDRPLTERCITFGAPRMGAGYACHEGNIAMTGILAGARAKERDAAQAAKKSAK